MGLLKEIERGNVVADYNLPNRVDSAKTIKVKGSFPTKGFYAKTEEEYEEMMAYKDSCWHKSDIEKAKKTILNYGSLTYRVCSQNPYTFVCLSWSWPEKNILLMGFGFAKRLPRDKMIWNTVFGKKVAMKRALKNIATQYLDGFSYARYNWEEVHDNAIEFLSN
jgi:hypothetical protein